MCLAFHSDHKSYLCPKKDILTAILTPLITAQKFIEVKPSVSSLTEIIADKLLILWPNGYIFIYHFQLNGLY